MKKYRNYLSSIVWFIKNLPYSYKGILLFRKQHNSFHKQQYIESIDYCNQLISSKLGRLIFLGYYSKAQCLIELKLYEEARENLSIALKAFKNPLNNLKADTELLIYESYKRERNLEVAISGAQKILETNPKHAGSYVFLAKIKAEESNYTAAIEIIHNGILKAGNHPDLLRMQANLVENYRQQMTKRRIDSFQGK